MTTVIRQPHITGYGDIINFFIVVLSVAIGITRMSYHIQYKGQGMNDLKLCPMCQCIPKEGKGMQSGLVACNDQTCILYNKWVTIENWNHRPTEDKLRAILNEHNQNIELFGYCKGATCPNYKRVEKLKNIIKSAFQNKPLTKDEIEELLKDTE